MIALRGTCSTLIVRVEMRKGNVLYINDGAMGLFEVAAIKWMNKVSMIRKSSCAQLTEFSFYLSNM